MGFCTLAVGSPYNEHLKELSNKIELYSLTDKICNSKSFLFKDDLTHIWQQKRHILRSTLELEDQAIFIDSDIILTNKIQEFELNSMMSGYVVGTIEDFTLFHKQTLYPILDRVSNYLKVDWHNGFWVSPMLFGLKRNKEILEALDVIAIWLRDNGNLVINDGNTLGLACLVCNVTPTQDIRFREVYDSFKHLKLGTWRYKNILT